MDSCQNVKQTDCQSPTFIQGDPKEWSVINDVACAANSYKLQCTFLGLAIMAIMLKGQKITLIANDNRILKEPVLKF